MNERKKMKKKGDSEIRRGIRKVKIDKTNLVMSYASHMSNF